MRRQRPPGHRSPSEKFSDTGSRILLTLIVTDQERQQTKFIMLGLSMFILSYDPMTLVNSNVTTKMSAFQPNVT